MGITGLLPLLKSIHNHTHVKEFAGKTFAIDAYVEYVMSRVRMLRHYGVEPYLVFDGGPLPAKKCTETDRAQKRAQNLAQAKLLTEQGNKGQARDVYARCVDVTPEMAFQVIKALKVADVKYVVAPYEADAQMTYLEKIGVIDGVITEDSDLLVFGCRHVLFKLENDGRCVSIKREHFGSNTDAPMSGWTDKEFREMAILSGCDYLPSIVGLGVKTAHKLLRKYKTVEKVLQYLRLESSLKIPSGYIDAFRTAELPFLHQRVYDHRYCALVYLSHEEDIPAPDEELDGYYGRHIEPAAAKQIAEGLLHPETLEPLIDINPDFDGVKSVLRKGPLKEFSSKANKTSLSSIDAGARRIDSFFSKASKNDTKALAAPATRKSLPAIAKTGAASGKRTLFEQMDLDSERRKAKHAASPNDLPTSSAISRFFSQKGKRKHDELEDDMDIQFLMTRSISQRRSPALKTTTDENTPALEVIDPVIQEAGYRSPTGSSIVAVSSPPERSNHDHGRVKSGSGSGDAEPIIVAPDSSYVSSPETQRTPHRTHLPTTSTTHPTSLPQTSKTEVDPIYDFLDESSDLDPMDSRNTTLEDTLPETPPDALPLLALKSAKARPESNSIKVEHIDIDDDEEPFDNTAQMIMKGWRDRWSHASSKPIMPGNARPRGHSNVVTDSSLQRPNNSPNQHLSILHSVRRGNPIRRPATSTKTSKPSRSSLGSSAPIRRPQSTPILISSELSEAPSTIPSRLLSFSYVAP